jgi:hypothetical protein
VASMKLAQALEHAGLFPTKAPVLAEFSERFLSWLAEGRLEEKTKKFYRNGCRMLKVTTTFSGSHPNDVHGLIRVNVLQLGVDALQWNELAV